jgi:hypothetical protein
MKPREVGSVATLRRKTIALGIGKKPALFSREPQASAGSLALACGSRLNRA